MGKKTVTEAQIENIEMRSSRTMDIGKEMQRIYEDGYNKGVEDFAEKILEYCSMSDMNRKMIRQIAEKLKGGANNG